MEKRSREGNIVRRGEDTHIVRRAGRGREEICSEERGQGREGLT